MPERFECLSVPNPADPNSQTFVLFTKDNIPYLPFNLGPASPENKLRAARAVMNLKPRPQITIFPNDSEKCGFKSPHLILPVPSKGQEGSLASIDLFLETYFKQESTIPDNKVVEFLFPHGSKCLSRYGNNLYLFLSEAVGFGFYDMNQLKRLFEEAKAGQPTHDVSAL